MAEWIAELRRLDRALASEDLKVRAEAQQHAREISPEDLDQLVRLAKEEGPHREMAERILFHKWEFFFKALAGDVLFRSAPTEAPSRGRAKLRKFARRFLRKQLADNGVDRESIISQARFAFKRLLERYDPTMRRAFPGYIEDILPYRLMTWIGRQMKPKRPRGRPPAKPAENRALPQARMGDPEQELLDRSDSLFPFIELVESAFTRTMLLLTLQRDCGLVPDPAAHGTFRELIGLAPARCLVPFLLPRRANLSPEEALQLVPRADPRKLVVCFRRGDELETFLSYRSVLEPIRDRATKPGADKAWQVLAALYGDGGGLLRQRDLAERLGVNQQRISHLFGQGVKRLLREYLKRYQRTLHT